MSTMWGQALVISRKHMAECIVFACHLSHWSCGKVSITWDARHTAIKRKGLPYTDNALHALQYSCLPVCHTRVMLSCTRHDGEKSVHTVALTAASHKLQCASPSTHVCGTVLTEVAENTQVVSEVVMISCMAQ